MQEVFASFDVGGTNIESVLFSTAGNILASKTQATQNKTGKRKVAARVVAMVEDFLMEDRRLKGIILAWPSTANLSLSGMEIKKILQKKFKVPIVLENDANVFALAEAIKGQGRNYSIVVGLTLGTGIGCGLVIDKKIYHGRADASEFGHVSLNFSGPKCVCGNYGCFEEYAGSRALKRLAFKYRLKQRNGLALYELAKSGDKKALALWKEYGKQLAWGVISIINALDPEIIVIGGNISKAHRFFYASMKKEIAAKAMFKGVVIKFSSLVHPAAAGSVLLFKK